MNKDGIIRGCIVTLSEEFRNKGVTVNFFSEDNKKSEDNLKSLIRKSLDLERKGADASSEEKRDDLEKKLLNSNNIFKEDLDEDIKNEGIQSLLKYFKDMLDSTVYFGKRI